MSEIDQARERVKAALLDLDQQLRPQEASQLVADLEYMLPAAGALITEVRSRLAASDRLPGLYSTRSSDARAELTAARDQLRAAAETVDALVDRLAAAHESLAALGHGPVGSAPLSAVNNDGPPPRTA